MRYPVSPLDHRYEEDPEFRALVTSFEVYFETARFSLTEIRSAAVYAAIRWEMRRPIRFIYDESCGELCVGSLLSKGAK